MMWKFWAVPAAGLIALGCSGAFGQTTEGSGQEGVALEAVEVKGVKDPDAFNVKDGLELMSKFHSRPSDERDKIRLAFYVQGKRGGKAPQGVRLNLSVGRTDETRAVGVLPTGEVLLPEIGPEDAGSSELLASVRRGSVRIVYFVQVVVPEGGMTVAYLRQALVQARSAWRVLYGPLMGLTVPAFSCAEAHFVDQGIARVRRDGVEVWRSTAATSVRIPVQELRDDDQIGFESGQLVRIGGCVAGKGAGSEP